MTLQNRRWCEARSAGRQTSPQSGLADFLALGGHYEA